MNGKRYIRDSRSGAVIIRDPEGLSKVKLKESLTSQIESLKADINTLKSEISELKSRLDKST